MAKRNINPNIWFIPKVEVKAKKVANDVTTERTAVLVEMKKIQKAPKTNRDRKMDAWRKQYGYTL